MAASEKETPTASGIAAAAGAAISEAYDVGIGAKCILFRITAARW
jgi:hypothetical protein